MKNLFKYLGAFAIAGALGLSTVNVKAEKTCGENETLHTNYYLFLNVGTASGFEQSINGMPEGKKYTMWNGANKYNNIKRQPVIGSGAVAITKGTESTSPDARFSWTAGEYWDIYYTTRRNMNKDLVYSTGNVSYILHDKWWTYTENYENGEERTHVTTELADSLDAFISNNRNNLDDSNLVKYGTSVPTSYITPPGDLETNTDDLLFWKISRVYDFKDILTGITLKGNNYIYSPAVEYVEFCVENNSVETKTITYDANTSDTVISLPNPTTYTAECATISSATPERSGYKFLGWSTDATSTTADYNPGDEYCGDSITLHAIWQAEDTDPITGPFTVKYNANGGKDAPATQTGQAGSCVKISDAKPTLQGNNFLGWSRNKDAREPDANFAAGKDYCGANGDIELFAVWQTQTGVSAHFIAFGLVAVASVAALVVAKKKNLFKQI